MENMWDLRLSSIPAIDPPEGIVEEQCDYLEETTAGRVLARVTAYSGPTSDYFYTKYTYTDLINVISRIGSSSPEDKKVKVNIQEDLSDINNIPNMYFAFEFFLTSPSTPNYKYRIMFFTYTAGQYPVGIVLDNDIANEISEKQDIKCNSEDEFKDAVKRIINSNKVRNVIDTLNAIALNMEKRKSLKPSNGREIQNLDNTVS